MELEYAFLADAAQVVQNKLYVLGGGFDRIFAPSFPATHPSMTIVLGVKLFSPEYGREHKFEAYLADSDGKRLVELQGGFRAEVPADDPVRPTMLPIVINIAMQQFPKAGSYAVYIVINNEQRRMLSLQLVQTQTET